MKRNSCKPSQLPILSCEELDWADRNNVRGSGGGIMSCGVSSASRSSVWPVAPFLRLLTLESTPRTFQRSTHTLPDLGVPCRPLSTYTFNDYPARALRALGLLLADGTPTGGRGEDFLSRQPDFFTETAVTPERKVEKSFPRWEINRHVEG